MHLPESHQKFQLNRMRLWATKHGQHVQQRTVMSMTTKDNQGKLPINLDPTKVKSVHFTDLSKCRDETGPKEDILYPSAFILPIKDQADKRLNLVKLTDDATSKACSVSV